MSTEADAQRDLDLSSEDAEQVGGGRRQTRPEAKRTTPAPAVVDTTVQASGGGWQPVVDDPSEDC